MKIKSKQAVYLDAARKKALPANHPEAAYLLVGAGCEIDENELDKYDGAEKHVNSEAKPYTTVEDTKIVGGKEVAGDKVKIDQEIVDPAEPATQPKAAKKTKAAKK